MTCCMFAVRVAFYTAVAIPGFLSAVLWALHFVLIAFLFETTHSVDCALPLLALVFVTV